MWCGRKTDEELAAVRIRAAVRHAQDALASVFEIADEFIFELGAVDRAAAHAGAGGVAALDHKARDDAVEDDVVVFAG